MIVIFTIFLLVVIILLARLKKLSKKIALILVFILLLITGILSLYFTNKNRLPENWIMKIQVEGYDVGYGNEIYIYKNHNLIIEPNFSYKYRNAKYKINDSIDLDMVYNNIIADGNKSFIQDDGWYYKIIFNTDKHDEGRIVKYIKATDEELKDFIEQIPLEIFQQVK